MLTAVHYHLTFQWLFFYKEHTFVIYYAENSIEIIKMKLYFESIFTSSLITTGSSYWFELTRLNTIYIVIFH